MKHMIFTRPAPEKQLSGFIMNEQTKDIIEGWIGSNLDDVSLLVIRSDDGNGRRHLLHAFANEMRKKGAKSVFLQFKKGDSILNLSRYHYPDILKSRLVFTEGIETLFGEAEYEQETVEFLNELAKNHCKVICSLRSGEDPALRKLLKIPFTLKPVLIDLASLTNDLRRVWAKKLLDEEHYNMVEEKTFAENSTNVEFLRSMEPFIKAMHMQKGTDHSFNREYSDQLDKIRLELRRNKLKIAELQIEKTKCIRDQHYEQAAALRERERELVAQCSELKNEVTDVHAKLPFTPGCLNQHYDTLILLNEFDPGTPVRRDLQQMVEKRIDALEKEWEDLKETGDTRTNKHVITELRDWEAAIDRFTRYTRKV